MNLQQYRTEFSLRKPEEHVKVKTTNFTGRQMEK